MSSFYPPSLRLFNFQQFHCHCRNSWIVFIVLSKYNKNVFRKMQINWPGIHNLDTLTQFSTQPKSLDQVSWLPNNKYDSDSIIININPRERDGVTCNTCNCGTRSVMTRVWCVTCDMWHVTNLTGHSVKDFLSFVLKYIIFNTFHFILSHWTFAMISKWELN